MYVTPCECVGWKMLFHQQYQTSIQMFVHKLIQCMYTCLYVCVCAGTRAYISMRARCTMYTSNGIRKRTQQFYSDAKHIVCILYIVHTQHDRKSHKRYKRKCQTEARFHFLGRWFFLSCFLDASIIKYPI